jgi:hypothetical protein
MDDASAATPVARDDAPDDGSPVKRPDAREPQALAIPSLRVAFQQVM